MPEYRYDKDLIARPKDTCPTINFNELKAVLLGKATDEANTEAYLKLVSGDSPKFLDSKVDLTGQRIAFASFPRSGNSFFRKMIETITGVFTGSDVPLVNTLALQ